MKRIGGGYTNYFNCKYKRSGALFQGKFKSVHIKTNAHLLYLSAYVNKNYNIHGYRADTWEFSSLPDYLGKRKDDLCNKGVILEKFKNSEDYADFASKNALHMEERKEDEKYLLEKL